MRKSAKEYLTSLGRWGWLVLANILQGIWGILSPLFKIDYSPIIWGTLLGLTLLIAPFIAFHKMRIRRDELLDKAKPKLRFEKKVEQIRQQIGESFCLEICNQGTDSAMDCKGILIAVEFAIEHKGLSMRRWPVHQPLIMNDSIGGKLSSILEVIHKEPSSRNGFEYHFAYKDNVNRTGLNIPTGQDILIIIAISSRGAYPLYAVCIFRGLDIPAPTKFEIIDSGLEECPTIPQCREMLAAHNAKTEMQ